MASEPRTSLRTQLTEAVGPNHALAPMIVPPDGGWGWIIVMVGLLGGCVVDGIIYSFYLFREPMSRELNIKEADISILSSLITGFYFVGAVFACSFGNHWGFRMTMVFGCVVTSLSFASGYILQEIIYYFVVIGVVGGIGSGFISVGGGLPASFYFDKKRSIALGIVSCGSGVGGLVMPHIVELFMKHYGWRNTFLFEAGILGFAIFLGLLIRPLKPLMVVIEVESPEPTMRLSRLRDDSIMDYSAFRVPQGQTPDAISFTSRGRSIPGEGVLQPTIAQIMADDITIIRLRELSTTNLTRHDLTQSRWAPRVLQPSASNFRISNISISASPFIRQRLPWYKCGCCRSKYIYLPERPLMRDDLYYTGNLKRLDEYTGRDDLEYHMQVTRVPTYYQTLQDLTKTYTTWCCHNILSGLQYLVDYKMLKSPAFDCLALCGFGIYFAFYMPYIFCKVHLEEVGAGDTASTLVSLIGLGSMIGRLLSGLLITACPKVDAQTIVSFMTLVSGASITCMVFHHNIYFKGICLFIFGFTIGYYVPCRSLIIVDYFGLQKLTSATGLLIICLGAGSFMGPPTAEYAIYYTHSNNAPFYACGLSLLLASLSLLPMERLHRWEKKRAERKRNRGKRQSS